MTSPRGDPLSVDFASILRVWLPPPFFNVWRLRTFWRACHPNISVRRLHHQTQAVLWFTYSSCISFTGRTVRVRVYNRPICSPSNASTTATHNWPIETNGQFEAVIVFLSLMITTQNLLFWGSLLPLQGSSCFLLSQLPQKWAEKWVLVLYRRDNIPLADVRRAVMSEMAEISQHSFCPFLMQYSSPPAPTTSVMANRPLLYISASERSTPDLPVSLISPDVQE